MPVAQTRLETLQICKLIQCVRDGDKSRIEKMTLNGVPQLINFNEPQQGDTALNIAAAANDEGMIEFLLELGAHPDVVDTKRRSAVMRAAEYGHVQCLEKLAKAGADMKLTDLEGKGIIFYSISPTQRHQRCLEIALMNGADVNNKSNDGFPVFLTACETAADNEEMCLMMLKRGADPNSKHDKTNRTALMAAAASGSGKVVRAILERGAEVNILTVRTKIHAGHEAARGGFFEVLAAMSAYGANFDMYDDQGNSPIHLAALNGHDQCCKYLVQRGCNPKPKNNEGQTARTLAKDAGHKLAVKECRKGEKIFGKTGKNNEPWAILLYDYVFERRDAFEEMFKKFDADGVGTLPKDDFVEGLQNMGAPIPPENDLKRLLQGHDKGRDGDILYMDFLGGKKYVNKLYLMSAFEGKKKKKKGGKGKKKKGKTKILMPICTQPDGARSSDGGPPQIFVSRHIHFTDTGRFDRDKPPEHVLQDDSGWYLHRPDKTYINLNDAVRHKDSDTLKDALDKGLDIDTRDKYFKTPLMVACSSGNLQVCKFLIEHGANVNAQDNFKWTPLHHAAHAGLVDVVELLLDNGAQLEAITMNGATPLMRAIESSRVEVVEYLIAKGAKVQIENKKGHNPVDIAMAYGDARVFDVVKTKWDSLPPPNDKKKGGAKKKAPAKRPQSVPPGEGASAPKPPPASSHVHGEPDTPNFDAQPRQRKGSILRAASALAGGIEECEDVTYEPIKVWTKQPTTEDLIQERVTRRERYGWEVDFEDFQMPFLKNVYHQVEVMGGAEED